MNREKILKVDNLTVGFQYRGTKFKAVRNVSFDINEEETLAIVGESGSGKSTLAYSIMNLLPPNAKITTGDIIFKAKDKEYNISKLSPYSNEMNYIRANEISMIFQEPSSSLNPVYKVGWQIDEKLRLHTDLTFKERYERIVNLLKELEINDPDRVYQSYPFQLSGGMNQRVMIAIALIFTPRLLICDEPTSALDVTVQEQILIMLNNLQKRYKNSIIFITHDLSVALSFSDKIMVMYLGFAMENGKTSDILSNPLHPYTHSLLESNISLDNRKEKLKVIKGEIPTPTTYKVGCPFAPRCQYAKKTCFEKTPPIISTSDREIRCWMFENEGNKSEEGK